MADIQSDKILGFFFIFYERQTTLYNARKIVYLCRYGVVVTLYLTIEASSLCDMGSITHSFLLSIISSITTFWSLLPFPVFTCAINNLLPTSTFGLFFNPLHSSFGLFSSNSALLLTFVIGADSNGNKK